MFINFDFDDAKYFCKGLVVRIAENETVKKVASKVAVAAAGTTTSYIVSKKLHDWFDKPKKEEEAEAKGLNEDDSSKTIEVIA